MPTDRNSSAPSRTLTTVDRSIAVLLTLKSLGGATVPELIDEMEVETSTMYNHLATLKKNNLIVKENGSYKLSLRFVELGEFVRNNHPLYQAGIQETIELANQTSELASLYALEASSAVSLFSHSGNKSYGGSFDVGQRKDLYATACGRAILSQLPEKEVRNIINLNISARDSKGPIEDTESLFDKLEEIKQKGYVIAENDRSNGELSVAAPVSGRNGRVYGSLSISAPSSQVSGLRNLTSKFREVFPKKVVEFAELIEENLAARDPGE